MTGKTDALENDILDLLFKAVAIADLAENDTSSPATNLYFSLHTATLDDASTQATSEIAYTNYARVAVARGAGFTVTGNSVSPAAAVTFAQSAGGAGGTVTHFGIGTNATATQAGYLMYWGTVTPNIVVTSGVTPQLTTASAVTED